MDRQIRALYEGIAHDPWRVIQRCQALVNSAPEPLEVVLAMREATRAILADFAANGPIHQEVFGNRDDSFFRELARHLDQKVGELLARGGSTAEYNQWLAARDPDTDRRTSDLLEQLDAEEALQDDLRKVWRDTHLGPVGPFLQAITRIGELRSLYSENADYALTYLNNAALFHAQNGDQESARSVVACACERAGSIGGAWPHIERLADTSLGLAHEWNDDALAGLVLETLVPPQVETARLAFRLACHYARVGEKSRLLEFARMALRLGKRGGAFKAAAEFASFNEDPEFVALLGA